nr:hypothetical protein [Tanacetum cinerariifolium]
MKDNRVADVDDRDQMEGANMEKEGVFRKTVYDEITQNSPTGSNNVNINDKRTEEASVGNENNYGSTENIDSYSWALRKGDPTFREEILNFQRGHVL